MCTAIWLEGNGCSDARQLWRIKIEVIQVSELLGQGGGSTVERGRCMQCMPTCMNSNGGTCCIWNAMHN